MASADPLHGAFATVQCRDSSLILCHTQVGLSKDDFGTCTNEGSFAIVRINDRLSGQEYIDTLIHEFTHEYFPDIREKRVRKYASQVAPMLFITEVRKRAGWS